MGAVGRGTGLYAGRRRARGAAGLLGSLAESVIGTVAERRGWLDNDLLNALNTAIGAALAAAGAPAAGRLEALMNKIKLYVDFARPFTLLPPALGVVARGGDGLGGAATTRCRSPGSWRCRWSWARSWRPC